MFKFEKIEVNKIVYMCYKYWVIWKVMECLLSSSWVVYFVIKLYFKMKDYVLFICRFIKIFKLNDLFG